MTRAALLHIINPELGQFYGGLLHVLLTLEHVLPLVVLGILAGFQGKAVAKKILLIAVIAALAGGVSGGWLRSAPAVEALNILNQTSFVVLGLLVAYHLYCGKLVSDFKHDRNRHSHVWYRWFNELPVLALIAIILLAVLKPE